MKRSMEHAHELLNNAPDIKPGMKAKWNTHSARRGGAKRAVETRGLSGVSVTDIEFHFGWDEKTNAKDNGMMWLYAGDADRRERRRVTAFF